jgi:hypothetical protein
MNDLTKELASHHVGAQRCLKHQGAARSFYLASASAGRAQLPIQKENEEEAQMAQATESEA